MVHLQEINGGRSTPGAVCSQAKLSIAHGFTAACGLHDSGTDLLLPLQCVEQLWGHVPQWTEALASALAFTHHCSTQEDG